MVRIWVDKVQEELHEMDPFFTSTFKDQIQTLQKQLSFLRLFFWCFANWSDDSPPAAKVLEASDFLEDAVIDLILDASNLGIENLEVSQIEDIESLKDAETEEIDNRDDQSTEKLFKFLEKAEYFKPVLKEAFLDLSDLSLECKYTSKDDIRKLIDFAIKKLKILVVLKPDMSAPVKMQLGAVERRLEFISAIFHFASREQQGDQSNNFFNHLKDWANSAAGVAFLYWVSEIDERVNAMVSCLIEKFKPCTLQLAELYFGALKALKPCDGPDFAMKRIAVARFLDILGEDLVLPIDDGFEMFKGLIFFISFVVTPPHEYAEEEMLISTLSNLGVNEAASLICSLYESNLKQDIAKGRNILLHDLVEKMNRAQAEIRELHLEIPDPSWNNFPRTNVQGFLDFFLEDLKEKLIHETVFTTYEKHQIMIIQKQLLSLKPLFLDAFELQDENEQLKNLWTRISRMAYHVDYVVDSCFFLDATIWCNMMRLSNVIEEIQFIKTELNKSKDTQMYNKRVLGDKISYIGILPAQANRILMDDVIVGFTDETEKVIDGLTKGLSQLDIVAIVGMPGQGKTTLAKKVYHDRRVRLHFKKHAWCCISQAYKIKDILMDILEDVNSPIRQDQISDISQEELAEKLYRSLKGRTYLIVLDDIWEVGAWNELKESFPEDNNGSRIIFTSRIHRVALEAKPDCSLHELHPLSFEDSWKLLQLKLSYQDGCPLNLVDIGKQIAENCKGLPLAIVVIAGLLAETDGNRPLWEQIAESLNSQIAREGCLDTLELSYKHLPDYLKPCFIYLSTFPEDHEILAKNLTRLWISEGFVQKHEMKSLEDVANEYLMDLVGRSLLLVGRRSSRYGIKSCRVHDLVRQFCLEKANGENFLLVTNISDDHSSDTMHQGYRLCIHAECWPFYESKPTAPTVRTLLFFDTGDEENRLPSAPFFFIGFKFLRVLDLEDIKIDFDIEAITQLVHLRYLALWGEIKVPSSIVNLSRLEVLYLITDYVIYLPETMWKMRSLRHLYVYDMPFKYRDDDMVEESLQLDNLQTLTFFYFNSKVDFEWLLRRIPNVRKLGVRLDFCFRLSDFLHKLESLNLTIYENLSPGKVDLPLTLRKLRLRGPTLSASMTSTIGRLPNLEVLKLLEVDFEDQRWDVEDDEFATLKYLELWVSDIEQWKVSDDSFSQLQQLLLNKCNELREIPSRFEEIPSLRVIKVSRCCQGSSVANSFHEIVSEQQNCGNGGLRFVISSDRDSSDPESMSDSSSDPDSSDAESESNSPPDTDSSGEE